VFSGIALYTIVAALLAAALRLARATGSRRAVDSHPPVATLRAPDMTAPANVTARRVVTRQCVVQTSRQQLYRLIADPEQMAAFSPECRRVRWLAPSARATPGARFRGYNRHGPSRWRTTCTITAAEPGHRFAYPVADWTYELHQRENDAGTDLIVTTADRRGPLLRATSPLLTGVHDRAARNTHTVNETLSAIARHIEERGGHS
jgi:uncharacterized protein YndB with AHSA1/START domain